MNKQCIHPKEKLQTNFINVRQIQMSHKICKCQPNFINVRQTTNVRQTINPAKKNCSIPRSARLRLLALKNIRKESEKFQIFSNFFKLSFLNHARVVTFAAESKMLIYQM